MNWMARMKIMPLMIIVAALSFGVRFGDFITGMSANPGVAHAESIKPDDKIKHPSDVLEVSENKANVKKAKEASPSPSKLTKSDSKLETSSKEGSADRKDTSEDKKVEWKDSSESDLEFSAVRMELFEDLSARRKGLETREREIVVRESLLKVAEQEINQKYKELVSLRSELQDLLQQQSEEEKKRIASLVKIYEGMKPKDAARIFNTLDVDVLLQVVTKMSERKSAPIIAAMNAERARTITIMLAQEKSLPDISDSFIP